MSSITRSAQRLLRRRLSLLLSVLLAVSAIGSAHATGQENSREQLWFGTLDVGAAKLRLLLRVTPGSDGSSAKLVSLDQGNAEFEAEGVVLDGKVLSFEVESIKGKFTGTLSDNGSEATGDWVQLGMTFELTLKRVKEVPKKKRINRPQTPKPPFPYRAVDVSIKNEKDDVTLAGTLTLPKRGRGSIQRSC